LKAVEQNYEAAFVKTTKEPVYIAFILCSHFIKPVFALYLSRNFDGIILE